MKESCEWTRERLARYLDDELEAGEGARVARHLNACPQCAAAYAAMARADQLARDAQLKAGEQPGSEAERDFADLMSGFRERFDLEAAERFRRHEMEAAARDRTAAVTGGVPGGSPSQIAAADLEAEIRRAAASTSTPASGEREVERQAGGLVGWLGRLFGPRPALRWAGATAGAAVLILAAILVVKDPSLPRRSIGRVTPPPAAELGGAVLDSDERALEPVAEAGDPEAGAPAESGPQSALHGKAKRAQEAVEAPLPAEDATLLPPQATEVEAYAAPAATSQLRLQNVDAAEQLAAPEVPAAGTSSAAEEADASSWRIKPGGPAAEDAVPTSPSRSRGRGIRVGAEALLRENEARYSDSPADRDVDDLEVQEKMVRRPRSPAEANQQDGDRWYLQWEQGQVPATVRADGNMVTADTKLGRAPIAATRLARRALEAYESALADYDAALALADSLEADSATVAQALPLDPAVADTLRARVDRLRSFLTAGR